MDEPAEASNFKFQDQRVGKLQNNIWNSAHTTTLEDFHLKGNPAHLYTAEADMVYDQQMLKETQ